MTADRNDLLKKISLLEAISEVSKALVSSLDQHEVLATIFAQITKLLAPGHWGLYLLEEAAGDLTVEIAVGLDKSLSTGQKLSSTDVIGNWIMANKKPLLISNLKEDQQFANRLPERVATRTEGSLLAIPLLYQDYCLGYIELISDRCCAFGEEQLTILLPFADMAAIAINNAHTFARMERLNYIDDCTDIYNSRFLYKAMADEVNRSLRYSHPLSCLFIDLDHFKLVNDNYGHLLGTKLLQEVATLFQNSKRNSDLAFRYGGDEFVLLLPETNMDGAKIVAARLLAQLREHHFLTAENLDLSVTASIGVASLDMGMSAKDLLELADEAMYWVKQHGRSAIKAATNLAELH